jgi:outer membrane protein OmpA-like peptidoglycan-associated protein
MKTKVGALVAAALIAAPLAAQGQNLSPGFYVGIEGGLNFIHNLNPAITGQTNSPRLGFAIGGVIGYDFVGPRVELEIPYRRNNVNTNYGLTKVESIAAMVNVLYDFFPQSVVSPHLGAGVGIARVTASQTEFAYQGIAGLSAVFADSFRISLDYKFFGTTNPTFAGATYRYLNHSAMLTLAYKFGSAPAAPPPPPPPTQAKAYMVFFDFDRSTITATAATTIKQAAADAKAGQKTRIGVTGHADRSGADAYNMALSLRRANAVKDQLVREGIPASGITVVGRGESQPLVQTADGVREPQNRRVEIVLN